jgi:hypothetical protein
MRDVVCRRQPEVEIALGHQHNGILSFLDCGRLNGSGSQ